MKRLTLYKIENGFYLTPAIELYWEDDRRMGICFMWFNYDMTIWLKREPKKEREYSVRKPADPFGEHFSHHKAAAIERCGTCLEPKRYNAVYNNYRCVNAKCEVNLGYKYPRR